MQVQEQIIYRCLGHIEPIWDNCNGCEEDEYNLNCSCYRPVRVVEKYSITGDEDDLIIRRIE